MKAIQAALELAAAFGVQVKEPVPLRSTNNTVVWLRPAVIVAKVGVGHHGRLADELQVAMELTVVGGPMVPPASEIPQIVHRRGGFDVSFWRYYPQPPEGVAILSAQIGGALRRLHASLGQFPPECAGGFPRFWTSLAPCGLFCAIRPDWCCWRNAIGFSFCTRWTGSQLSCELVLGPVSKG